MIENKNGSLTPLVISSNGKMGQEYRKFVLAFSWNYQLKEKYYLQYHYNRDKDTVEEEPLDGFTSLLK